MFIPVRCQEWDTDTFQIGGVTARFMNQQLSQSKIAIDLRRPSSFSFYIPVLSVTISFQSMPWYHCCSIISRPPSSKLHVSLYSSEVMLFSEDSGMKRMNSFRDIHLISLIRKRMVSSWESFEFLSRVKGTNFDVDSSTWLPRKDKKTRRDPVCTVTRRTRFSVRKPELTIEQTINDTYLSTLVCIFTVFNSSWTWEFTLMRVICESISCFVTSRTTSFPSFAWTSNTNTWNRK